MRRQGGPEHGQQFPPEVQGMCSPFVLVVQSYESNIIMVESQEMDLLLGPVRDSGGQIITRF